MLYCITSSLSYGVLPIRRATSVVSRCSYTRTVLLYSPFLTSPISSFPFSFLLHNIPSRRVVNISFPFVLYRIQFPFLFRLYPKVFWFSLFNKNLSTYSVIFSPYPYLYQKPVFLTILKLMIILLAKII